MNSEAFNKKVLFIGGARSGKSSLAQQKVEEASPRRVYLATGVITDQEMAKRVALHRKKRSEGWETLEVPFGFEEIADRDFSGCGVLLDCVTFLVSNLLLREKEPEKVFTGVTEELGKLFSKQFREGFFLALVSNEVGCGVVPESSLGRQFRDLQGRVNQWLAQKVDQVFLVVAGVPWRLK
ncbi:MAG: bifunctional adenosylcobinamide kinase/adenosylcobinamide-phosphate guanylyltransferase [Candidatus Atribacteria bacterium]|nr:bifunctional adenosylcobinamide kinase/adenosylcobinamide-phosphate guanylyltransferase [Candidatus Atribacteria bacterium]MCD6349738.1 bifunctional adenosylcobinamide kinase/adenosylcobinamide-phosphate guanylyltransferase [Candidatus Atribacteria bacterium]